MKTRTNDEWLSGLGASEASPWRWMPLSWFGDAAASDDEAEGAGEGGFHDPAEGGEDDFELLVAGRDELPPPAVADEYAGKTKEEVLAELKAEREKAARLAAAADTNAALLQGLRDLKQPAPVPTQAQAPVEQWKPLTAEEVNPTFIDDPFAATQKIVQDQFRKLEPVLQKSLLANKSVSRALAELDPDRKVIMDKYGPEVEQEVAAIPPAEQLGNTDLYKQAADRVKLRHLSEIQNDAIAAALKAKDEEIEALKRKMAGGRQAPYTEKGGRPATTQRRTVIASEKDVQAAAMMGMDIRDYMRTKNVERSE